MTSKIVVFVFLFSTSCFAQESVDCSSITIPDFRVSCEAFEKHSVKDCAKIDELSDRDYCVKVILKDKHDSRN